MKEHFCLPFRISKLKDLLCTFSIAIVTLYILFYIEKNSNNNDEKIHSILADLALNNWFQTYPKSDINILTPDGAWCWFADPRAVFYEGIFSNFSHIFKQLNFFSIYILFIGSLHQNVYIGWVNKNGDIVIGCIDYNSLKPLKEFVIKKELQVDDHANPSILILQVCRLSISNLFVVNCNELGGILSKIYFMEYSFYVLMSYVQEMNN